MKLLYLYAKSSYTLHEFMISLNLIHKKTNIYVLYLSFTIFFKKLIIFIILKNYLNINNFVEVTEKLPFFFLKHTFKIAIEFHSRFPIFFFLMKIVKIGYVCWGQRRFPLYMLVIFVNQTCQIDKWNL